MLQLLFIHQIFLFQRILRIKSVFQNFKFLQSRLERNITSNNFPMVNYELFYVTKLIVLIVSCHKIP